MRKKIIALFLLLIFLSSVFYVGASFKKTLKGAEDFIISTSSILIETPVDVDIKINESSAVAEKFYIELQGFSIIHNKDLPLSFYFNNTKIEPLNLVVSANTISFENPSALTTFILKIKSNLASGGSRIVTPKNPGYYKAIVKKSEKTFEKTLEIHRFSKPSITLDKMITKKIGKESIKGIISGAKTDCIFSLSSNQVEAMQNLKYSVVFPERYIPNKVEGKIEGGTIKFSFISDTVEGPFDLTLNIENDIPWVYSLYNLHSLVYTSAKTDPSSPDGENGYFIKIPKITLITKENCSIKWGYTASELTNDYKEPFIPEKFPIYFRAFNEFGPIEDTQEFKIEKLDVLPVEVKISLGKKTVESSDKESVYTNSTKFDLTLTIPALSKAEVNFNEKDYTLESKSDKETTFKVDSFEFKEGKYPIIVKITTIGGRTATITKNIVVDLTPPTIVIEYLSETFRDEQTLIFRANEEAKIESKALKSPIEIKVGESQTAKIYLDWGVNKISFTATDPVGNKSTKDISILRQVVITLKIGSPYMEAKAQTTRLDSPPVIKEGRTLVPIRAIVEVLGGVVEWDSNEKKVTIILSNRRLELWIGKNKAKVTVGTSTKEVMIDPKNPQVMPLIINGRTMLPLRFVAENLGCTVEWFADTQTIKIIYKGGK